MAANAPRASSAAAPNWVAKVDTILALYAAESIGLAACADQLEAHLDQMDLTYTETVKLAEMGVHPMNREIMEHEIPGLMEDIHVDGFSARACNHALSCEQEPGELEVETHSLKLCNASAILAPFEPGQIKKGSLSCSHFQQGLRAIAAGRPSEIEGWRGMRCELSFPPAVPPPTCTYA